MACRVPDHDPTSVLPVGVEGVNELPKAWACNKVWCWRSPAPRSGGWGGGCFQAGPEPTMRVHVSVQHLCDVPHAASLACWLRMHQELYRRSSLDEQSCLQLSHTGRIEGGPRTRSLCRRYANTSMQERLHREGSDLLH